MIRVEGDAVFNSRASSYPDALPSATREPITAICACVRRTTVKTSDSVAEHSNISNRLSLERASTSNWLLMDVLSAASTRIRSASGNVVT